MKSIQVTLWMEILKTRKSNMFWGSILFFILISSMMGLLMYIQMHPEVSEKLGIIGTKASFLKFGGPNWNSYFTFLMQGVAAIGLIGIGFVTSWIFGREFSDHTVKDILVIPVSRAYIVYSKLIVVVIWSFILSLVYFVFGIIAGILIGLPDLPGEILSQFAYKFFITTILNILLSTPVAFLASYSRGYLMPLGFVILTVILANLVGMVGLGPYFPWAIPGFYGTPGVTPDLQLNISSYIILICTCLVGLYGTIAFWRYADQK